MQSSSSAWFSSAAARMPSIRLEMAPTGLRGRGEADGKQRCARPDAFSSPRCPPRRAPLLTGRPGAWLTKDLLPEAPAAPSAWPACRPPRWRTASTARTKPPLRSGERRQRQSAAPLGGQLSSDGRRAGRHRPAGSCGHCLLPSTSRLSSVGGRLCDLQRHVARSWQSHELGSPRATGALFPAFRSGGVGADSALWGQPVVHAAPLSLLSLTYQAPDHSPGKRARRFDERLQGQPKPRWVIPRDGEQPRPQAGRHVLHAFCASPARAERARGRRILPRCARR